LAIFFEFSLKKLQKKDFLPLFCFFLSASSLSFLPERSTFPVLPLHFALNFISCQGRKEAIMKQVQGACGHLFTPKPNNREKQKYCAAPACQRERNRIKNHTYREKKKEDREFKLSEAQRQQRIRDRLKELARKKEARPSSLLLAAPVTHPPDQNPVSSTELAQQDALLGLTSLITGSDSPAEIRISLAHFIEKGKRLRAEYEPDGCVSKNST